MELGLQRAWLGISKINHLLDVKVFELARDGEELDALDRVQEEGLRRLVPSLTMRSSQRDRWGLRVPTELVGRRWQRQPTQHRQEQHQQQP